MRDSGSASCWSARSAGYGWKSPLEAQCRLLGENHPTTLAAMNRLAGTLKEQGDLAGARSFDGNGREVHGSEDAGYLDARVWSEADQQNAMLLQKNLEILVNPNVLRAHVSEYPAARSAEDHDF
jgi:hypothetical protein